MGIKQKGVRAMRRYAIARLCMYAAFAATTAVSLGGCSGGLSSADNGAGAPAAPTTPTTTVTAPTTAAGIALTAAAAAAPVTTNTAQNPTQAFGLVNGTGLLPVVTVNSPPVVNFAVIDANGKHVPGLKLVKAGDTVASTDPACSTTRATGSVSMIIAKWDTSVYPQGVWQNLISRQRYATSTTNKNSVAEGTTDPVPDTTTTYQNPATVAMTVDTATGKATVSDQANQIVGMLTENATEGYYTYAFATDVVTKLLFADATDKKNVSLGKVANNGNLAVKDGATIHRVAALLCYTDPASKQLVKVAPYVDFTLAADGTATPLTVSATDKTPKPFRKVVDKDSCNECHKTLTMHGGLRADPNVCVMCHNPGSTDFDSNNPIDLKLMIHKFHRGENLTQSYRVRGEVAYDSTTGKGKIYPQDVRNCVKCHDGSTTATHKTADGDNWKSAPSRNACGACHDGIDFATGGGTTIKGAATGHGGGIQGSDSACSSCHSAAYVASKHVLPSVADASQRTMSATITAAAVDATTGKVTVTFTMTKGGVPVTGPVTTPGKTASFTLSEWTLAKLVAGTSGSPSRWQSYTARWRTKDAAKPLVIQGYSEAGSAGTLTEVGSGVYTYTFALLNATTPGNITTNMDKAYNKSASSITGTYSATSIPSQAYAVTYDKDATHRVGLIFTEADGTGNHDNATFDFVPSGAPVTATRNIIDVTSCRDGCHSGTIIHKGYNTKLCVTCHTETTFDPFTGDNPVTVDLKYMVHRIHMGDTLPGNVRGIAIGGMSDATTAPSYWINDFDTSDVAFPQQPVSNCLACHLSAATAGYSEAANWKTVPNREVCGSCHDGITFASGGGSTLKDVGAWSTAGKTGALATSGHAGGAQVDDSRCATCHDAGSVTLYHIK